MALIIPEAEMSLCKDLVRSAWAAVGLINDLYSWEKEYEAARKSEQPHIVNAIWVIMRELSISAEEAKVVCREKIEESVAEYLVVVQQARVNPDISSDLRTYVEAIQYSLSGNLVWSVYCPRYHPEASYDSATLLMMEAASAIAQETC